MNLHLSQFKKLASVALVSAAACIAAPAHADIIGFESASLSIYQGGEKFTDSGFNMTVHAAPLVEFLGLNGQSGRIINGSDPASCAILACPSGNLSQYYAGDNDGSLAIARDMSGAFSLSSLRFGFVVPTGGVADGTYGQLQLTALLADGSTVTRSHDFAGQDIDGNFMFSTWNLDTEFAGLKLANLSVNACVFDIDNNCVNDVDNYTGQAQFAIDDLDVSVPLPGTVPLMLAGLAGLAALRRRRA